ncbi:uncharacterized protein LOC133039812 [Cannabis sativa]|uniref:uncharacterized protein LOC133039812 n=1 Tax=Cannabis sativa TaxID=3483 RepID=UPI0029CA8A63|nr:uncharacterized protein LOC133039812 [Cannabis sativa]
MNQAFLPKWGWNILTGSQSLCCRVLSAKYLKGRDFLKYKYKSSDSWFWKSVVKANSVLKRGACKLVANGENTSIWEDPWIPHSKGFCPKPIRGGTTNLNRVSDLLLPNGLWNVNMLKESFDHETVVAILKGGHPSGRGADRWIWTQNSNGRFSCKSAYLVQALDRAPQCDVAPNLWNKLWTSKILERHKILWWCILSNALPTRAVINQRFHIEDTCCPLCGNREETMEHLFLTCDVAMHLWRSSPWGFYPICDTGIRVWDWVKFIWDLNSRGVLVKDAFLYASIIVDTIWRVRNDKVHNNRLVDVKKCIDDIYFVYADLKDTLLSSPTSHLEETWSPPPRDWIKLNCDVKVGFDNMCVAVVARNHLGAVIEVRTARVDFSDALYGEAEACCLAISMALELGYKFIIIENDSRVVINALNGLEPRWAIENYVSFCTKSSQSFISYYATCLYFPLAVDVVSLAWSPPLEDWIKINCNVKVGSESMCVVVFARDHSRKVLLVASNILNFTNPLIGEAEACRLALEVDASMKHDFVLVESDSEKVIKPLKG